jgi:signal transduction histidine kinase
MLSLNLTPKEYFEMFNQPTQNALKDTEMLNRAMYHKIQNEISILKEIVHEIIADTESQDEMLLDILKGIEMIFEGIKKRRHQEESQVKQIPADDYEEIIAIISQTAHGIVDFVNNELAVIQEDIWDIQSDLDENEPRLQELDELQKQLKISQAALDDLKSVNEGIKSKYSHFKVKELFETWQNNPKLRNATISLDIHNPESEFYGDKQKIESFLSELVENSLKHNANKTNLQIHINANGAIGKIPGSQKHLVITYRDNGKGLSRKRKEWVFLPLKTTMSKTSSGLGLFMIKRTLTEMNGTLIEKGKGGVNFEIKIPYGEEL